MTLLATLDPVETPDPVAEAIAEHLANPSTPVTRLVKAYGISRATFYRHLAAFDLSSTALDPVIPQAPEVAREPDAKPCPAGCGLLLEMAWSDEQFYRHWAYECHKTSLTIKWDAEIMLRESECSTVTEQSIPQPYCSGSSETMLATDATSTEEKTSDPSITPLDDASHSSSVTDPFYMAKFLPNGDVRDDWDYAVWVLGITGGITFGTKDCTTVTRPRRKR